MGSSSMASCTITKVRPQTLQIPTRASSESRRRLSSLMRLEPPPALGAHAPQRALRAARRARDAGTPAVADQQHVRLVGELAVVAAEAGELVVRA